MHLKVINKFVVKNKNKFQNCTKAFLNRFNRFKNRTNEFLFFFNVPLLKKRTTYDIWKNKLSEIK